MKFKNVIIKADEFEAEGMIFKNVEFRADSVEQKSQKCSIISPMPYEFESGLKGAIKRFNEKFIHSDLSISSRINDIKDSNENSIELICELCRCFYVNPDLKEGTKQRLIFQINCMVINLKGYEFQFGFKENREINKVRIWMCNNIEIMRGESKANSDQIFNEKHIEIKEVVGETEKVKESEIWYLYDFSNQISNLSSIKNK